MKASRYTAEGAGVCRRDLLGCFGLRDVLAEDVTRFMFEDVRCPRSGGAPSGQPCCNFASRSVLPAVMDCERQRGLGIARAGNGSSSYRDLAGPGFGELFVAPCEIAVEVVDLLFVGRRRAAVFEGAEVPGLEFVAEPEVAIQGDFVAGAEEAEIAVTRVVELVATAHDGAGLEGGTKGFRTGWPRLGKALRV